jgi:hypothetical protein
VSPVRIIPVDSRRTRAQFVDVPRAVYAGDPAWVEPLRVERLRHLSPKNPFFMHATGAQWIALQGDKPVGRISAQIDRLHVEQHGEQAGFFGMLDAHDDAQTFAALFETAEAWLCERGMQKVLGPFNLSINEDCGLLIEGFDSPPQVMMPHGRPFYPGRVEACGYSKAKDLLAYRMPVAFDGRGIAIGKRAPKGLHMRPLSKAHMDRDMGIVRELFNDAWSQNWGFVAFTDEELSELASVLKHLVPADFVWFAERRGEPVGFLAALPNVNEAIADLHGRLLPFGWAKLLWRLKVRTPSSARIALLGLRSDLQKSLGGARIVFRMIAAVQEAFLSRGVDDVELSWVLEDNIAIQAVIGSFTDAPTKRYRIYTKDLA